jgi:hypothetical protein
MQDGTILIEPQPAKQREQIEKEVADRRRIVL